LEGDEHALIVVGQNARTGPTGFVRIFWGIRTMVVRTKTDAQRALVVGRNGTWNITGIEASIGEFTAVIDGIGKRGTIIDRAGFILPVEEFKEFIDACHKAIHPF